MIQKVLIFLVLLIGGFAVLYSIVEQPKPAGANGTKTDGTAAKKDAQQKSQRQESQQQKSQQQKKDTKDPRRNRGDAIAVPTNDGKNTTIEFQPGGKVEFPRTRVIQLPDREVEIVTYRLRAEDSRAEQGDKLALEDVTIEFFETDMSDPKLQPRLTSTVTASKALVELTRDDKQVLIDEDKLMQFWDLVYRAGGDLKNPDTKIRVGQAQAINTPDMIHIWTKDDDELVRVEQNGPDGIVITGRGLDAWLPSIRNEEGEVELKPVGIRDVKIKSQAAVVRGSTSLRSKGPLRLKEDARTGTLHIQMIDRVELTSLQDGSSKAKGLRMLTATGDRLDAFLARADKKSAETFHWRRIELTGKPTRLQDRSNLELTCGSLQLLPDARGEPYWVTARGKDALAPVVTHHVDGVKNTYRAHGDVHVIQVGRQHGYFLNSYGLTGGIPTFFDQVVLFEGKTVLDSPRDKLHISSARGLTMLRSSLPELKDYAILRGRGAIHVTSSQVRATGNRGFVLRQRPVGTGKAMVLLRDVQLGPAQADPAHNYDVRKLPLADPNAKKRERMGFHLKGSGMCKLRLRGEVPEEIHLSSLGEDITIAVDGDEGRLWNVRTLDAWFATDGTPTSMVAKGRECQLTMRSHDDVLHGKAKEIHHPAAHTYRLVGNLAEAKSEQFGLLHARDILVQHLDSEDVRVRATHQAKLVVTAKADGSKLKRHVDLDLAADEIRLEPFLMPPTAQQFHNQLLPAFGRTVPMRYVFAKGNVVFDYTITENGRKSSGNGKGDDLRLRRDRAGTDFMDGRLFGKPATIVSTDAQGRKTSADSYEVAFAHDARGAHIHLHRVPTHRPILRLLDMPAGFGDSSRLALTAESSIDLSPERIHCPGKVTVRALDDLGKVDPEGYKLDANTMRIERTDKGEIESVLATGDVEFRWADASGQCDSLEIDVLETRLIAKGTDRPAIVRIPTGTSRVGQLNYNYRTKMVKFWKGKVLTRR